MTNNLFHQQTKKALKNHLEDILSACVIDKGIVHFNWRKNEALYKFIKEAKKNRNKWMRDIDFYGVLSQEVSKYLTTHVEKWWEVSGKLIDIGESTAIEKIAETIISYLESIPRKYLVYFELPSAKGVGVKEIKLTDDISFIEKIDEVDFEKVKIPSLGSLLGGSYSYTLKREKIYICIQADGYADGTIESSAGKKAYSKFKQVLLLGTLSGVFVEKQRTIFTDFLPFGVPHVFVMHAQDMNVEAQRVTLSKAVFDYITRIELNETSLKPTQLENLLETFEDNETFTPNDKAKLLKNRFQYPIKLLKTPDNDEDSESLKSAIEWAFASHTNDNETLAFIQACIGLEAIIGDDNRDNITDTLADRCAYLLGDSISERKNIRENFKKLYGIRSKVVHGRKASLDDDQRYFLNYAQTMLKQVIWKEISFIESVTRS